MVRGYNYWCAVSSEAFWSDWTRPVRVALQFPRSDLPLAVLLNEGDAPVLGGLFGLCGVVTSNDIHHRLLLGYPRRRGRVGREEGLRESSRVSPRFIHCGKVSFPPHTKVWVILFQRLQGLTWPLCTFCNAIITILRVWLVFQTWVNTIAPTLKCDNTCSSTWPLFFLLLSSPDKGCPSHNTFRYSRQQWLLRSSLPHLVIRSTSRPYPSPIPQPSWLPVSRYMHGNVMKC